MKTDVLALLDELKTRGVVLALESGQLRARGDSTVLTPELRESLRTHKGALMELLGGRRDASTGPEPIRRERLGDQPLSSAQHRLWFVTELAPESNSAYNIIAAVRIVGDLHVPVLERALAEMVRRHEVLRTGFVVVHGEPRQRISDTVTFALRHVALPDDAAAIDQLLLDEGRIPFDLQAAPLLRGVLGRISGTDHVLALVLHHLVSDGWSSGVMIQELAALYDAFLAGLPSPLPPLELQYSDYVEWQLQMLSGPAFDEDVAFWKRTLDGVPTLNLPTDHPRPPRPTYAGTSERFQLPAALTASLETVAKREGATLFMVLLAAFGTVLYRYTGQQDMAIGTTVANRPRTTLEGLVGFFTNMVAMRTDLSGTPSFSTLVRRVRDMSHQAFAHQSLPFDRVVEAVQPERVASHNPLVQVCFSLLQAHRESLRLGQTQISLLDPPSPAARFDLTLMLEDTSDGLVGAFEYSTDLFDRSTIVRLISHFHALLDHAAAHPDTPIADLTLLSSDERHRILYEWNDSTTEYPRDATVHGLIEEHADRTPDAIAVQAHDGTLTYGELNARANRLAHLLRTHGVGPEKAVAVAGRRSADLVVELLAILKAGGYYMPFDPADPPDRLAFAFSQANPVVILAPTSEHAGLAKHGLRMFSAAAANDASLPSTNPHNRTHPDNLIHTLYTSGSTGVPKGICLQHKGVVRLVRNTNYMVYDASLVFLELAPVSFDASTFEIWGPLSGGGRVVVMPPDTPSIRDLSTAIEQHGITSLYLTSALFNLMVDERVTTFAKVKYLSVGGDIISVPHARRLLDANPGITLINGYGPTETTVFASCGIMTRPEQVGYTVSIGRPISNTTLYVLDGRYEPTPPGVPGDLYIAGDGNARGYLNQPGLTAQSFIPNPFGAPGDRMYRTGDLARYLADGTLEFLGRKDNQVKIRGFRIELGEIENVLTAIEGVSEAAVLVDEARPGDKRLVAYVQSRDGQLTDTQCIATLRQKLPDFMVPSAFVFIDALPLTRHNKIDRHALRLITPASDGPRQVVAPSNPLESHLAYLWGEVLGIDTVGVTDNFFDLGGHSLLATQVMWRVFEAFNVEVPLRRLFESPTVAEFAVALLETDNGSGTLMRLAEIQEEVRLLSAEEVDERLAESSDAHETRYDQ